MTVVLLAVYVPIGFQGGLTGALFTEFVFTLAGAVTVSAVIALTLSPMMCSKLLKPHRAGDTGWEDPRGRIHRRPLRALARLVSRQARAQPPVHSGDRGARGAGAGEHRIALSQREERARAAGGSGIRRRPAHLGARCHAAAQAPLRPSGVRDLQESSQGVDHGLPDRGARPILRRLDSRPARETPELRPRFRTPCSRNSARSPVKRS